MAKTGWMPICDEELAAGVRAALLDIVSALRAHRFEDASLSQVGMTAVLFGYLERAMPGRGYGEDSEQLLDEATSRLSHCVQDESLYGGFTGMAWCVEHLLPPFSDDDPNDGIDQALLSALQTRQRVWHFDLISGLCGLGVYALERAPLPKALACAERIVELLASSAERRERGIAWRTLPQLAQHQGIEDPHYDLGLAHGTPGVVGFLAMACQWPELAMRARPLLEGGVAWLLSRPVASGPLRYAWRDGEPQSTRAAWCYGDPGVAAAILGAARTLQRGDWEGQALRMALECSRLNPIDAGVDDASMCHGSIGLAHLFARFHHASGEKRFAEASRRWFRHTLELKQEGVGMGGFACWTSDAAGRRVAHADVSFLNGAAGIGLGLLAGISAVEPEWDRVLLCSLAPRRRGAPG